jgi:hypothetical protein
MIEMTASRLLDCSQLTGSQDIETLTVGKAFGFMMAASYDKFTGGYDEIPTHDHHRGFKKFMNLKIHPDGTIQVISLFDIYWLHGVLLWVAWGGFGLF